MVRNTKKDICFSSNFYTKFQYLGCVCATRLPALLSLFRVSFCLTSLLACGNCCPHFCRFNAPFRILDESLCAFRVLYLNLLVTRCPHLPWRAAGRGGSGVSAMSKVDVSQPYTRYGLDSMQKAMSLAFSPLTSLIDAQGETSPTHTQTLNASSFPRFLSFVLLGIILAPVHLPVSEDVIRGVI